MLATSATRHDIIARLNDRCRSGLDRNARTVITRSCLATFGQGNRIAEVIAQAQILAAIRRHSFAHDDDTERNRGSVEFRGQTVYFVIDAYDLDLAYGSPDPSDASVTRRVMTIMLREDL